MAHRVDGLKSNAYFYKKASRRVKAALLSHERERRRKKTSRRAWSIMHVDDTERSSAAGKPLLREGIRRLLPEESAKISRVLGYLVGSRNARSAFLVGMDVQEMASEGSVGALDREAICSLAAGVIAATRSLAGLIGEETFQGVYHRGKVSSALILPVGDEAILLLVLENRERERRNSLEISQAAMVLRDLLGTKVV